MTRFSILLWAALLAGCQSTGGGGGERIEFALIGDNPYVDYNMPKYEIMIAEINAAPGLDFVMHAGDVKGSGESCADESLSARFELNQQINLPFILTPGDNDWFDCSREYAGGWDRADRLAAFRRIWYPAPGMTTGARPFDVATQADTADHPDFVENVYWTAGGVIFGTIHLVGLVPGEGGEDIHQELMGAALAWIDRMFAVAQETGARGVLIATQVDPYLFSVLPGLLTSICKECPYVRPGYQPLNDALVKHSTAFGKPVVLVVGDTHIFRVDKPLYDGNNLVENFTRVEVFGHPNVHWVRGVINPDSNEVFEFHQELIEANYGVGWPEGHSGAP